MAETREASPPGDDSSTENSSEDETLLQSEEMAKMDLVIQSDRPEALEDLLCTMTKENVTQVLTKTTGGVTHEEGRGIYGECENGSVEGTPPILQAVLSGKAMMFSAIHKAMRTRHLYIPWNGGGYHRTLLSLAAGSGNRETFKAVLDAFESDLTEDKVTKLVLETDLENNSLLMAAAKSGSKDTFEAALDATKTHATKKVPKLIALKDNDGDTLLSATVKTSNLGLMKVVLECVLDGLGSTKFQDMLMEKYGPNEFSLVVMAVRGGDIDFFSGMITVLKSASSLEQVQQLLLEKHISGASTVVIEASKHGNIEFFKEMRLCLQEHLTINQVEKLFMPYGRNTFLVRMGAARHTNIDFCRAMVACLEKHLTSEQAQEVLMKTYASGEPAVVTEAARHGGIDFFKAVITCMKGHLEIDQVQGIIMEACGSGDVTVATEAAKRRDIDFFRAVIACLEETMTRDQVESIITATRVNGTSLLVEVARQRDDEFFDQMITCLKERLPIEEVENALMRNGRLRRSSVLVVAAERGGVGFFRKVVTRLSECSTDEKLQATITKSYGDLHASVVAKAAELGDVEFFREVLTGLKNYSTTKEVQEIILADGEFGDSWLVQAARHEDIAFFSEMLTYLMEHLTCKQVLEMIMAEDSVGDCRFTEVARQVKSDFFTGMIECMTEHLSNEQVREITLKNFKGKTLLGLAFERKDAVSVKRFLECLKDADQLEGYQVAQTFGLDVMVHVWANLSLTSDDKMRIVALKVISYLLANYARPSPDDLTKLSRWARLSPDDSFKTCCLRAVTSAANCFIPGMVLSVALAEAARRAVEGEKGSLISLQKMVDTLMLEIFDHLPQTVRSFKGGMDGCSAVLEPELTRDNSTPIGTKGPLSLALQERHKQIEKFCTVPLIMDFLSRRFTCGLPDLRDTDRVLSNADDARDLRGGTDGVNFELLLHDAERINSRSHHEGYTEWDHTILFGKNSVLPSLMSPGALLQGANFRFPSLTILPGAQFVFAGLVARPSCYYQVPVIRMVLDVVVYAMTVTIFSIVVIFHEDGPLTWGEGIFAHHIVAACFREAREIWRDGLSVYLGDRWNFFDMVGLSILSAGLCVRVADNTNPWGHALYALSAPLVVSRTLFFAEILRFQGPMIEVIFGMTTELIKFGIVMMIVMIGFAISFHSLFHASDSFGETLLSLFKAMLGEVEFFDEFSGGRHDLPATLLLVAYLIIITIMLLNLLVAILSTSHSKAQENVEQAFMIPKARMIQRYRSVVKENVLPAPFNLSQLILSIPFELAKGRSQERVKEAVGRVVLWAMLGPLAVFGGGTLWMASAVHSNIVWHKHYSEQTETLQGKRQILSGKQTKPDAQDCGWERAKYMVRGHFIICMWCFVGAPLCLFGMWLRLPTLLRRMGRNKKSSVGPINDPNTSDKTPSVAPTGDTPTTEDMLQSQPGRVGAEDLREYLDNHAIGDGLCDNERRRRATVEHVKLLRNRLETSHDQVMSSTMHFNNLEKKCDENKQSIASINNKLEKLLSLASQTKDGPQV